MVNVTIASALTAIARPTTAKITVWRALATFWGSPWADTIDSAPTIIVMIATAPMMPKTSCIAMARFVWLAATVGRPVPHLVPEKHWTWASAISDRAGII